MSFDASVQYHAQAWGRLAWRRREAAGSERPTLLLVHGLGGDQEDWQGVAAAIPADWPLLSVDLRGHGRSSSPEAAFDLNDWAGDLWQLVHARGLKSVQVVGFGVGGLVAQAMAQHADGGGNGSTPLRGLVLIESFAVAAAKTAFRRGRYSGRLPADRMRRIQAKYYTMRDRFHPMFYDRLWGSIIFYDARPFLQSTALPVHHIFGDYGRDGETDRKLLLPIRPNIQLHWIADGGHHLLDEHPAVVARQILQAIAPG